MKNKKEKDYLKALSENEFKKYERCLTKAREGFEENNVEKIKFWLSVAEHTLKQSASYKSRSQRYTG